MEVDNNNNANADKNNESPDNRSSAEKLYACNICLECATDPIITYCGHLFDWHCIYRWLEMHPHGALCPVCKAGIDRDKMIPIYSGVQGNKDPRDNIPDRPPPQRPPPTQHNSGQWGWNGTPGFQHQVIFGPGIFSTMLGMQFQTFPNTPAHPGEGSEDHEKRMFARLLFLLGSMLLAMILMM